jgi:hypothetical protein
MLSCEAFVLVVNLDNFKNVFKDVSNASVNASSFSTNSC